MSKRHNPPGEKGKGKEVKSKEVKSSFKTAALMDAEIAKRQKINDTPKEERLREDAYQLAVKDTHHREYIFPYIPISTKWVIPIEKKYINLQPNEVATFYFKDNADSFIYPKFFQYFQDILVATNSVEFDTTERPGGDIAYSKASIKQVIRPDQWSGDLFKPFELTKQLRHRSTTLRFNYFDYINAWEHAFYYENRQRKFSWWIQFSATFGRPDLPNWFITWFTQWGLYPICLPDDSICVNMAQYDPFNVILT